MRRIECQQRSILRSLPERIENHRCRKRGNRCETTSILVFILAVSTILLGTINIGKAFAVMEAPRSGMGQTRNQVVLAEIYGPLDEQGETKEKQ